MEFLFKLFPNANKSLVTSVHQCMLNMKRGNMTLFDLDAHTVRVIIRLVHTHPTFYIKKMEQDDNGAILHLYVGEPRIVIPTPPNDVDSYLVELWEKRADKRSISLDYVNEETKIALQNMLKNYTISEDNILSSV